MTGFLIEAINVFSELNYAVSGGTMFQSLLHEEDCVGSPRMLAPFIYFEVSISNIVTVSFGSMPDIY